MSEWISIDDRLPDEDVQVVCWCNDGENEWPEVLSHHNSFFTDCFHDLSPVTHWQPLPPPPSATK